MRGRTIAVLSVLLAIFMLTVSAPLSSATGEPSFTSASYDPASGKVSFAGTFDSDVSVSVHANGYYSGETVFQLNNGRFSGEITVGKLARGVYRIIAMSVDDPTYYIVGDFRVDGYLFLDSAAYSIDTGKVTVTGSSSDRDLEVTVRDASNNIILDGVPVICGDDRRFSSEFSLGITPTSDLKVTVALSADASVKQTETVQSRRVTTSSDLTVSMHAGESATVHLNVVGCTYSDLNIYSVDSAIAGYSFSTDTGDITISGVSVGETEVVASIGDSVVRFAVRVSEALPHDSVYTFTLRMEYDADMADYGESGYSASDLEHGITLTATGTNAGEALESALNAAKLPCHFWTKEDNSIRYWVNDILGLGDVKLENGDWKYWIQFQDVNGTKTYNQWSLGFYTEGGSFELVYGITSDPSNRVSIDAPAAVSGLIYNGQYQTGIPSGDGYTVQAGRAMNAGSYSAVLKLEMGYIWSDNTLDDKVITWSISKATLTATYAGETIREGTLPVLKVKVTGFVGNDSDSISGYVSPIVSATDLSVGVHQLTPSGGFAANYQFVYVPGNLEIVASSSPVHVHTWDDGVMTLQPTCTAEGVMTFTCTECGETYTESVSATGHSWSEWTVVTEATVDHDGVKERTCSRCGEKETESIPKIIVISNTDGSNTSIETQADGTQVKTTTGAADGSTTVETSSERIDENGNEVVNNQKTKTEADGSYTKVDETVVTEPDGKSSNTKITDIDTKVTDDSGNTASVKSKETDIRQSDGSTLNVKKTDTTVGESTTTEITANAVSADGIVQTTAEKFSDDVAEMVTQVKASEEDGTCAVSKESVQTALQQQDAISDLVGSDIEMTKVFEIASPVRDVVAAIEKESFTDMANAEVDLKISSTQGSMTMGKDVLSGLSQKEDVTLSLTTADRSSMTSAQRESIESGSTTVSLKAMAGGESIGDELGGKVTVSVKHIAAEGKKAVAYYVDDNGKMTKVADQTYDTEKGEMTMVLDHFSIYTIVDEDPVEEKELPVTVLVCLGMIVILSLAIMLPQVFGRKN